MGKKILKTVLVVFLILAALASGLAFSVYVFRDRIIRMAVAQANDLLGTPVEVGAISLEVWDHFPQLTVRFTDVKVKESTPVLEKHLATAGHVSISFRLYDLLKKNYKFHTLFIENAVINLAVERQGITNYNIFRKRLDKAEGAGPVTFNKVMLKNIGISYISLDDSSYVSVFVPDMVTKLVFLTDRIQVGLNGIILSNEIRIEGISYLKGEKSEVESGFVYNLENDQVLFEESSLVFNGYEYLINGMIGTGGNGPIDLSVWSKESNARAITALLPSEYRKYLDQYQSEGKIEFNGKISGELRGKYNPSVEFNFIADDLSLYHPEYKKSFSHIYLEGQFSNGAARNFSTSVLDVKRLSGDLEGRAFLGKLIITDLNRLGIDLDMTASLDLKTVLEIFPVKNVRSGKGNIDLNIRLSGQLNNESGKRSAGNMKASGEFNVFGAELLTPYIENSLRDMEGSFYFNNNDLAIENFKGRLGSSDFKITGFFKNIIPYILLPEQPILIEADFESQFLNLNELLKARFEDEENSGNGQSTGYRLDISPRLDLLFNCRVKHAVFKKFSGRDLTANLSVKDQLAVIEDARMRSMGGTLLLSGSVSSKHAVDREIMADGKLDNIYIDSVFYVFENFNQDFLVDRHLRGQIDANVHTYMVLDQDLKFYPESLLAFVDVSIKKGELINFEPMQNLSDYIDAEALRHLRFSELKNDILIKNKVITIPEMEIISNVSSIMVSGTHTFDQHIEYHFKVPLNQFGKPDPDQRFGEIEEDDSGNLNVFLKMEGTTNDYKVVYDTKAVKNKIAGDFRKEGRELKEIFTKKGREKPKSPELNEDEYIDD